jgi:hypothetical protein
LGLDRGAGIARPVRRQRVLKIKRPAIVAAAGVALALVVLLLVLWLRPSHSTDTPAAHAEAIVRVETDARLAGAPTGLGAAKWLMTSENVMEVAPGAKQISPGVLRESKKVYDRDAEVTYHFSQNELMLITVTFAGPSSPADFDQVQSRLAAEFGRLPAPAPAGGYTLASVKRIRHFVIEHGLVDGPGGPVEQVLFYAGQAGHPTNMPPVKVSR